MILEPEKLQIIQQYLKSSSSSSSSPSPSDSSNGNILSAGTFFSSLRNDQDDDPSNRMTSTQMSSTLMASVLSSGTQSFPENSSALTETETEATNLNSTRYCDDCLTGEVCVALVDEEVPTCRTGPDREDPTGCAGFCLINKQKCHRLDVDAFRFVAEREIYLRAVETAVGDTHGPSIVIDDFSLKGAWKSSTTVWTTSGRARTRCACRWTNAATAI